jgi:hypothetical protein
MMVQMSRGMPRKDAFDVDDAVLMSTLQEKLRMQKEELESRTDTIAAIQRNFESLSSVYMSEIPLHSLMFNPHHKEDPFDTS